MSKRRVIPVLVMIALVAAIATWWFGRDRGATKPTTAKPAPGSQHGGVHVQRAFPPDRPLPAWFTPSKASPRRIAGRVTLDGKPAANATVTLQSVLTHAGYGSSVEVRTGADGRFDLGEWPAASYQLMASAPDAQPAHKGIDLGDPTKPTDTIELKLRACASRVTGVISDANSTPIVEAVVRASGFVVARSNASGTYSVCVGFGDVELDYSADGYGAVVLSLPILGSVTQDVVLVPAASIAGKAVRADDGAPVPNALVTVYPSEWGRDRPGSRLAITDAAGAFRIDGLTPGTFRVWAHADGLVAEAGAEVQAQLGVVNEVTIKLQDRARVSGIVVRNDKPVAGVAVNVVRKSPAGRGRAPAWTRPDGTFVLDDAPIGDLVFTVDGYEVIAPTQLKTDAVKLYEGVKVEVASVARIHGIVTRNKIPLEGAQVWGAGGSATTDASGNYELVGVPPGTYQIGAGSEEAGAFTLGTKVSIAAGEDKTVDFELELAAEIAGTVVDAAGKPVPGVFVRWTHATTQDEGRGPADAQGRYRCRAMAGGGTYTAKVYARPDSQKAFPPAPGTSYPSQEVKDGTTKIEGVTIAIDLQQMTITGRVIDSAGGAVADAQVKALATEASEVHFNSWMRLPMTATDSDGSFKLTGLVAGTYALKARSTDGAEQIVPGIAAGATSVTIRLTRPGSIEGTLAGFTQPPVIYATPWNAPNKLYPGSIDGGRFTVSGIKPGRYIVNAQNMYEGDAKTIDVRAGEKATVALTARGRGSIIGSVVDFKTKKPIAGAICRAVMSVDGQQGLTNWDHATAPKSDETGRVVIDPAPAGNVTVACTMPNFRTSQPAADTVVPPGGRAEIMLYSAELTVENPAPVGAGFSWVVTPPRIAEVVPNSAAAKAGLLPGDLIVEVDGLSVEGLNGNGVQYLLDSHTIGATVSATYVRGTMRKTVTMTAQPTGP